MKKNCKGFTLLETLMVSVFIASTLVYLFIQVNNVKTNYDITFRYNTIPGLYGCQNINAYFKYIDFDSLVSALNNSSLKYVDITNGSVLRGERNSVIYYNDLVRKINAKQIIFTKEDTSALVNDIETLNFSEEMKNYIKKIESVHVNNLYRIIIEYNDNTFATLKIEKNEGAGV